MNKLIKKSCIKGRISAPSSKSALQRLIVAAMLSEGISEIQFNSMNEDSESLLDVAGRLGSKIQKENNLLKIKGGFHNPEKMLNIGESGLGLRMLAPVLASTNYSFELHGKGSLLHRPVDFVVESLRSTGVSVSYKNNALPLCIKGPVSVSRIMLDGSMGSQLLTGFLMAAPLLKRDITIDVDNLKSKPYIDLTIDILKQFGINILNHHFKKFEIGNGQKYHSTNIIAEGDWSGIAFMLVAAAISGEIIVDDLSYSSTQGDKAIIDVLKMSGAEIIINQDSIRVNKHELKAFEFDATDVPDLFPPLVSLAINCNGRSIIKGVSRLKHKESDRGQTLKSEFNKLGANISIEKDLMIIEGCSLKGGQVYSHNDHRIAMALAVSALNAESNVVIENAEAVGKSWPDFFEKLKDLGVQID